MNQPVSLFRSLEGLRTPRERVAVYAAQMLGWKAAPLLALVRAGALPLWRPAQPAQNDWSAGLWCMVPFAPESAEERGVSEAFDECIADGWTFTPQRPGLQRYEPAGRALDWLLANGRELPGGGCWWPGAQLALAAEVERAAERACDHLRQRRPRVSSRTLDGVSLESALQLARAVLDSEWPAISGAWLLADGGRVPHNYNGGRGAESDGLRVWVQPHGLPVPAEATNAVVHWWGQWDIIASAARSHHYGVPNGRAASAVVERIPPPPAYGPEPSPVGASVDVVRKERRKTLEWLAAACEGAAVYPATLPETALRRLMNARLVQWATIRPGATPDPGHPAAYGVWRGTELAVAALEAL